MTPKQCRAARAMLNWNVEILAYRSKIADTTIQKFEQGKTNPRRRSIEAIVAAFEKAGIEFVEQSGRVGVWLGAAPPN